MSFGNVAGGLGIQGGIGAGDMYQQYGLNAKIASDSWDRWKKSVIRGPKYAMKGLRRAGLNPILAAGQAGIGGMSGARATQASGVSRQGQGNPLVFSQGKLLDAQFNATTAQEALTTQMQQTSSALEQKYKADTRHTDTKQYLDSLDTNKKEVLNQYFGTAAGQKIVRLIPISGVAPKSFAELVSRGGGALATDPALREELKVLLRSAPSLVRDVLMQALFGGNSDE